MYMESIYDGNRHLGLSLKRLEDTEVYYVVEAINYAIGEYMARFTTRSCRKAREEFKRLQAVYNLH